MKSTATELPPESSRKKLGIPKAPQERQPIRKEAVDPVYQKLIDSGVVSPPVKVDPSEPIGTVFIAQNDLAPLAAVRTATTSLKSPNSPDSPSADGMLVGKPGQMMADVIREKNAVLKENAQAYFATAEAEKVKLAARASLLGIPLRFESQPDAVDVLLEITESQDPLYVSSQNTSAADTIAVDQLWPNGTVGAWNDLGNTGLDLSGAGEIIGLWEADGSVRLTHEQFGGRVTQLDAVPLPVTNHATGVAGALASAGLPSLVVGAADFGPLSRGVAYEASVNSYDVLDFTGEFSGEASAGLKFANNSYSIVAGWRNSGSEQVPIWRWFGPAVVSATEDWRFGAYTNLGSISSRGLDDAANTAPNTLLVYSAGNDQNEGPGVAVTNYFLANSVTTSSLARDWNDGDAGGYDTMSAYGSAKNVLTVGSINSLEGGWTSAAAVVQSSFSATGPTDDGRIKPEIVAQGSRTSTVTARNPFGLAGNVTTGVNTNTPNDFDYSLQNGTSFSAPSVTGVLALVNQRRAQTRASFADLIPPGSVVIIDQDWSDHPLMASGMRALMVHTADEAGPNPGPDYRLGYGVVNATRAVQLISNDSLSGGTPSFYGPKPFYKEVLLGATNRIQFRVNRIDANTPIRITAAWSDSSGPGQANNLLDPQAARLVNDLDVRIYPPGAVINAASKNAVTTARPWILNPDLTVRAANIRGAAATTGDDSRNNLEQVALNSPATGDYTVVVDHKGFALNGGSQWVSLVISGIAIPIPQNLTASITNNGGGNFAVAWPSVVGARYVIEATSNLVTWTPVSGEISANLENTSLSVASPFGVSSQFWRVIRVY